MLAFYYGIGGVIIYFLFYFLAVWPHILFHSIFPNISYEIANAYPLQLLESLIGWVIVSNLLALLSNLWRSSGGTGRKEKPEGEV